MLRAVSERVVVACPNCGQKNAIPWSRLDRAGRCGACKQALPGVTEPIELAPGELPRLLAMSPVPVVVDFWAPWCGPCRMVAPELKKVAARAGRRFVVAKVNTEADPQVAAQHGIRSIPLLAVFSGGRELTRSAGARPAPQIEQLIGQTLAVHGLDARA